MIYRQSTGELKTDGGEFICRAYAGRGGGKNSPVWQSVQNIGPLPRGKYTVSSPVVDHALLGPALMLEPDPANAMFHRAGFAFHLANPHWPGDSSEGCIVLPARAVLDDIAALPEKTLTVVE